jgi:hypothetical protein
VSLRREGRSKSQSQGSSEALIPTYEPWATSFHSKDNEFCMKGEMIRNLPVGHAVIKFRSSHTFLTVPPPRKGK